MTVETRVIQIPTIGNCEIIDITEIIDSELSQSQISQGIALIFVPGSTAAVTTIEYESGVVRDLQHSIESRIPMNLEYEHNKRWRDGNGHSHVRAAWLGPDLTIPVASRKLLLGRWQQVVLIDFDNQPRQREIVVQLLGE